MVPARQHYDGHFTTPSFRRRINSAATQRTNKFPVFGRSAEAFVAHDYGQPLVVVDAAGMEVAVAAFWQPWPFAAVVVCTEARCPGRHGGIGRRHGAARCRDNTGTAVTRNFATPPERAASSVGSATSNAHRMYRPDGTPAPKGG